MNRAPNTDQIKDINPMVNPQLQTFGIKNQQVSAEHFLDRLQNANSNELNNEEENIEQFQANYEGEKVNDENQEDLTDKDQIVPQISLGREYKIKEPQASEESKRNVELRPRTLQ